MTCSPDVTGDELDSLELVLNSVFMTELMRCGAVSEAKQFIATSPSLCFGSNLDLLLMTVDSVPALRYWRQLNDASPELLKCVWNATEVAARPSVVSLFEVALFDELYRSATSLFLAFRESPQHKAGLLEFLTRQDAAGDTVYAHRSLSVLSPP
jgi:hypothetical protein